MEDLIKRSDAIKALLDMPAFDCINKDSAIAKCIVTIKELPSADRPRVNPDLAKDFLKRQYEAVLEENRRLIADKSQGEWIPCSERVPIEYRTVLVTWKYAGKSYTTTAFRETKNAVTYWKSNDQLKYSPLNVVAWMPLPEPWKGAEDKEDLTEGVESRTDLIWYGDKTDLIGDETGRHTGWSGKGVDDEDN